MKRTQIRRIQTKRTHVSTAVDQVAKTSLVDIVVGRETRVDKTVVTMEDMIAEMKKGMMAGMMEDRVSTAVDQDTMETEGTAATAADQVIMESLMKSLMTTLMRNPRSIITKKAMMEIMKKAMKKATRKAMNIVMKALKMIKGGEDDMDILSMLCY
jgi:hypothetical protein